MTAEYFDQWFADIDRSQTRQQLFTDWLGLPEEVGPSNTVPLAGLREIAASLSVEPGGLLIDLACGRGGPGMWIARELGVELAGIDFSAEAIAQASARRKLFGLSDAATFAVGDLEDTGLPAGGGDALVCIDAFQFATDGAQAAAEIRRVLRSGGRVTLTSWEAIDRHDEAVSERLRKADLGGSLTTAGFTSVSVVERPDWHEAALAMWKASLTVDVGDDPALIQTRDEGQRSIANHDRIRRVMATAIAP